MAGIDQARAAKAHLRAALAGRSEVRGIGLRRCAPDQDEYLIRVNVSGVDRAGAALRAQDVAVPAHVDGVGVEVHVVGELGLQS